MVGFDPQSQRLGARRPRRTSLIARWSFACMANICLLVSVFLLFLSSCSPALQRGRGVQHRGALLLKSFQKFSEIFRGFQRFLEWTFSFRKVRNLLKTFERFSEPFPSECYPSILSQLLSCLSLSACLPVCVSAELHLLAIESCYRGRLSSMRELREAPGSLWPTFLQRTGSRGMPCTP